MAEVEMMSVDSEPAVKIDSEPAVKKQKKPQKKANKNKSDAAKGGVDAKGKNEGEAKKNAHRPNKDIVDLFWLVSNEDAKIRQAAISKLTTFSTPEDTAYILKRLVGGLASDRPLARPAFGVGLVSLLLKAAESGASESMSKIVMAKLGQLEVIGLPKEKRNAALGRISGYVALIRADLVSKESPYLLTILKDLVELSRIDRTTSKASLKLVNSLIDAHSTPSSFKDDFWSALVPAFKGLEGEKGDVEALTLLLNCSKKYPIAVKKRVKADLGLKLNFSTVSWSSGSICATFETAAAELSQPDQMEEAKQLFSSFITMSRDGEGVFSRFWTEFVCGKICPSKDKNISLLKILNVILQEPPTAEILSAVLLRRGLDALSKCIQLGTKNPGKGAAEAVVERLVAIVADATLEEDLKMIVIKAVVKQESGSDASGGGRLASAVNRLLSAAPDALLQKVWLLLREELLEEARKKVPAEGEDNRKKRFLWLGKQVQNCLQKSSAKSTWEPEALQLLFLLAHFQLPDSSEETSSPIPAKCSKSFPDWLAADWLSSSAASTPPLLANERSKIGEFIFDAVLKAALADGAKTEGILQMRHFVDGLLSLPPSVLQPQLSSPDVASTWQEISTIISSVEKQKSLLPEGQESPVLDVFQKLFLVMGFQIFTDLDSVRESMPDLQVCAFKGCGLDIAVDAEALKGEVEAGEGGAEEELKWIDVLTELLMSFLLKDNQNYRKLVVSAIPLLLPHFTEKSYQIIKDAAIGKFGGESVFALEDDEEEEDEEEEEEADEDDNEEDMEDDAADEDEDDVEEESDEDGEKDDKENTTEDDLQVLKMKLASAMGEARPKHLEMDPETDNEESDVDDEEMFKFDDKIAGVFKELESKRQASAEKKADAKKQKLLEESKMKFRLRCLDILSSLFLHVVDPEVFLHLFDTLVDLEASTRLKAGSTLSVKSDFDAKVKHLVKEVSQFRRGTAPKISPDSASTKDKFVEKLNLLLKDYLKHASAQSEVPTLCHILVKVLLASGKTGGGESEDQTLNDSSTDFKSLVNSAFLDYLDAALATSSKSSSSIGSNLKFEHFSLFESFVSRFQLEVVDESMLKRLEDVVFRKELTTFSRKHLVAIFNQVLGFVCRKEVVDDGEAKVKDIFGRNLKKCLDAAVEEVGKKETTGIDTSSVVSYLSIILRMHQIRGKIVCSLLTEEHRDSLRQLVSGMYSSGSSNAGSKIALDNLRRIGMYWGLTKEIQFMGAENNRRKRANKGAAAAAAATKAGAESPDVEAASTQEGASMDIDMEGKENQTKSAEGADALKKGAGGSAGRGKKRKRLSK